LLTIFLKILKFSVFKKVKNAKMKLKIFDENEEFIQNVTRAAIRLFTHWRSETE